MSTSKGQTSVPDIDELDSGWDGDDEPEEPDEPEPPGLTSEERDARLAAKKERARARAAAKRERRNARALAAASKQKPKQKKRRGRQSLAPSENYVSDPPPVSSDVPRTNPSAASATAGPLTLARRISKVRRDRQWLVLLVVAIVLLGGVAVFAFRK